MTGGPFTWHDGARVVRFGRGIAADAVAFIDGPFTLLTTPRASAMAPHVAVSAEAVHEVGVGLVDEVAGTLRGAVGGQTLVALGGGRVIDVSKALAAADPPRRVVAIPTTLSGAEMTAIHRHATGVPADAPKVRPAVVIADPGLSASQPEPALAASAANALGHAVEGPLTPRAAPVPVLAASEAIRLIAAADTEDTRGRDRLAYAAILAGYTIDATGYGLHHVMSQTLVRFGGVGHGAANAAMLPHTLEALRGRFPARTGALAARAGVDLDALAAALAQRAGAVRLRDLGIEAAALDGLANRAAERAELQNTPPVANADELHAIYQSAW